MEEREVDPARSDGERRDDRPGSAPDDTDEDELVDGALAILPEIGKLLYAGIARHPGVVGLPIGQLKLMLAIHRHGPCPVGTVAEKVGVSMPTASEGIERLVEGGIAQRSANPADRRQVLVGLTPSARATMAEIERLRRAQIRAALGRMAPEERPVLVRSLRVLAEVLRPDPGGFVAAVDPSPGSPDGADEVVGAGSSGAYAPPPRSRPPSFRPGGVS